MAPYALIENRKEGQRRRYNTFRTNSYFKLRALQMKRKAKEKSLAFDLDAEYLESIWTGICPISQYLIFTDLPKEHDSHAELDRIIPSRGYVKGNVAWIERKYNRIKGQATIQELKEVISWLEKN